MDRTREALERHATVCRFELDLSANVGNVDAAIVRSEVQIHLLRYEDFVTDRPVFVVARGGAVGEDPAATSVDDDLPGNRFRPVVRFSLGLDASAHQNLVLLPALYRHAAIHAAVDVQAGHGGNRHFVDLAV